MVFFKFKRKLIYFVMLTIFAVPVFFILLFLFYTPKPSEIILAGGSEKMGMQFGKINGFETKLVLNFYLKKIICQDRDNLYNLRKKRALERFAFIPSDYQEELNGMSKVSGIELGSLAYGNAFLDMGNYSGGCRSVIVSNRQNFLHSHNLDWDNIGGFASWTISIIRRNPSDGRFRTVSISFPGMIGSLDIISEKGLALSFNQLGSGNGNYTEPVFIMMRRICENSNSFNEARESILKAPEGMPFIITLSDAQTGKASIFERIKKDPEIFERKMKDACIGAMNLAQANNSTITILDQEISNHIPADLERLKEILSDKKIMMGSNIYSVIFDFRNNCFYLASGRIPAASGTFRKYTMF